jgi:hypothetical protein
MPAEKSGLPTFCHTWLTTLGGISGESDFLQAATGKIRNKIQYSVFINMLL